MASLNRPVPVTEATFDTDVVQFNLPVVVDFWAPWCGPCRMIGPILERLAGTYAGKVRVAKVNVDEEQPLAARYFIRGIPTLVVFWKGESIGQIVGYRGPQPLEDLFAQLAQLTAPAKTASAS